MKRYFLLLITLLQINIYANNTILDLSSESIIIHHYNEREYLDAGYVMSDQFNSGLEIYSETEDTKITLDGKIYRAESIKLNNLDEGKYYLEITSKGYDSYRGFIQVYSEKRTVIHVTLSREYGFLDIETNTESRELYLNGYSILGNEPIPTGVYNLTIKSFGYEEEYRVITIYDNFTTKEFFELKKAPFKLEKFQLSKHTINPFAEGGFAKLLISVSVNGPGSGILEIKDNDGFVLSSINLTFNDWKTKFYIHKGDYLPVKDGLYTIYISAENQELKERVSVNSNLYLKMSNITSSSNGLLYSTTPEINEVSTHQSSFNLHYNSKTNELMFPISYRYNFNNNVELVAGFDLSLNHSSRDLLFKAYSSVKTAKQWGKISAGLDIKYMFTEGDKQSYITLMTPLSYGSNNIYMNISPSYNVDFSMNQTVGGSLGMFYDNQSLRTGLSLNINQDLQYNTGFEIWKLLADSQSYMGVNLSYSWDSVISVGFGINNIY